LADELQPLYSDEQGPNCNDLNLPEGLAARFQSLPSFSKLVIFRNL
jgi:hypothetical protein